MGGKQNNVIMKKRMKIKIAGLLLLSSINLSAQEVLFPYKKGNLFGLVNEKDEFVVQPKYSEINWLLDKYFLTGEKVKGSNSESLLYRSLYFGSKEIIGSDRFLGFQILPDMMISGKYQDFISKDDATASLELKNKSGSFALYDWKGNLVQSGFKRLDYIDSTGVSVRGEKIAKYTLLFAQTPEDKFGVFVFDTDAGKIKEWLFEGATNLKVEESKANLKTYYLNYTDKNNLVVDKKMGKENGYFYIVDYDLEAEKINKTRQPIANSDVVAKEIEKGNIVPANQVKDSPHSSKTFRPRILFAENQVKFIPEQDKYIDVKLAEDEKPIFMDVEFRNQIQHLIYKKGNKFGLIKEGKVEKAEYDSLAYFGNDYFLACNKVSAKWKCGTLSNNGEIVIPLNYDSISGSFKHYRYIEESKGIEKLVLLNSKSRFYNEPKKHTHFVGVNKYVIAYKDGKVGMMKLNNEIVFPVEYDEIGENSIRPFGNRISNFIVLKKDNHYGVVMMAYDPVTKETYQQTIEPLFPYFPAFYLNDYYNQPGLKLFGLMDEKGNFITYASEIGKLYMD